MTDFLKEEFDRYLENMDKEEEMECECGAKHTEFPTYHYQWCMMWAKEGGQ